MMTIEKFHEAYWSDNFFWLNDHMYFHQRASEKRSYWNEEEDGKFDPHYSMNNFSRRNGRPFTPQEIEKIYDSIDWDKYAGKKFIMGDYTFYVFASGVYKSEFYKTDYYAHGIYMEYKGYRITALDLKKGIGYEKEKNYSKGFEGLDIMLDLLKDNPDIELIPCKLEEITGPIGFKLKSDITMIPPDYPQKKHPTYKWEGAGEKISIIDLDHFIKMDIKNGVYEPSNSIMNKLLKYEVEELLKTKTKKLKDLGVHTIKFKNNSNWNIGKFYNIEGIELKASKSVLARYDNLRKYSKNEKAKEEILAAEKAEQEAYEKSVYDDTYTLMQHGKVILENVLSYDITHYFENKENKDFELSVIEAGKKCFEVAPDLNKIFFGKFGIYSYTEMSGERFADFEDIERINKLKDIKLPKRLITLVQHGEIDYPFIDKDDKLFDFDKGATYIGVSKDKKGNVTMVLEDGDQGI
jgi:hypothetical protein